MNFRPVFLPLQVLLCSLACSAAQAELKTETYGVVTLDEIPPHTITINTFNDQVIIYNADTHSVLGTISTGNGTNALEIDRNKGLMHAAETYLSRHTRGERTDVVTTYDIKTLSAVSEIVIPPKHSSGSPQRYYTGIVRDDVGTELMLVNNVTPAVSISVVDLNAGKFITEISTAGCGLIYPVAGLRFLQLCGDGSAQLIILNTDGSEADRIRSDVFFDLQKDPMMEKGIETSDGWIFSTFKGDVYRVSAANNKIVAQEVFQIGDETGEWRVGGMQPLAYHAGTNMLLALMHEGGEDTHKDPGTEVWYYNLATGRRVYRLQLTGMTTGIQVSQDDQALLYAGSLITNRVDFYDLKSGSLRGSTSDLSLPTILQNLSQ